MTFINPPEAEMREILRQAKRIAIVGLSSDPNKISYQIAERLKGCGYEILPVNPGVSGKTILGETVYDTLEEVPGPIDIVNVFRKSEALPEVAQSFLKTDAPVFWAQLGVENRIAAEILASKKGITIIMNFCIQVLLPS